jgi:hypothetical protein
MKRDLAQLTIHDAPLPLYCKRGTPHHCTRRCYMPTISVYNCMKLFAVVVPNEYQEVPLWNLKKGITSSTY